MDKWPNLPFPHLNLSLLQKIVMKLIQKFLITQIKFVFGWHHLCHSYVIFFYTGYKMTLPHCGQCLNLPPPNIMKLIHNALYYQTQIEFGRSLSILMSYVPPKKHYKHLWLGDIKIPLNLKYVYIYVSKTETWQKKRQPYTNIVTVDVNS